MAAQDPCGLVDGKLPVPHAAQAYVKGGSGDSARTQAACERRRHSSQRAFWKDYQGLKRPSEMGSESRVRNSTPTTRV